MAQLVIPWQCWETPGFKLCHSAEWERVRSLCLEAGYTGAELERCVEHETILASFERCAPLCLQMRAERARVDQEIKRSQTTKKVLIGGAVVLTVVLAGWALTRDKTDQTAPKLGDRRQSL